MCILTMLCVAYVVAISYCFVVVSHFPLFFFFFFNDTATTEIYTLSLHDALPICSVGRFRSSCAHRPRASRNARARSGAQSREDRKSTRLNSSHLVNLVCRLLLEKKKTITTISQSNTQHT